MGQMVIACYRPHEGKEAELMERMREHMPVLRAEGLITERPPAVMRAADGAIVEVFEWKSAQAVESAHTNPNVLALWDRFGKCCDFVRLADLQEAQEMFPNFEAMEP